MLRAERHCENNKLNLVFLPSSVVVQTWWPCFHSVPISFIGLFYTSHSGGMCKRKRCEIKSKSATPSVAKASKQASIYLMSAISASSYCLSSRGLFQDLVRPVGETGHAITTDATELLTNDSVHTFVLVFSFFHGFFFCQRCLALKVSVNRKSDVCHFKSRIAVIQTSACMPHHTISSTTVP